MDDSEKKRVVLIDLNWRGDLRGEDFDDLVVPESRKTESTVCWSELESEMDRGD